MTHICVACGVQYPESERPPAHCPICEDERQYIPANGQQWTTPEKIRQTHRNAFHQEGEGVWGIETLPEFGIGQRALLMRTGTKNILWDCISLLDTDTITLVKALGGVSAIAISHPHYYGSMADWSRAFGGVPIYLHEDDSEWVQWPVQGPDANIKFWKGETHSLENGLTLIRVGGHFAGSQVLHSATAENGHGALFSGDLPQVCPDKRYVSFMYSYPNYTPLNAVSISGIIAALEPFEFAKLYGAFTDLIVQPNAKEAVLRSAERYLKAIGISSETKRHQSAGAGDLS